MHVINDILNVVGFIASFRLNAVCKRALAARGLGDGLSLRIFIVLLSIHGLGRFRIFRIVYHYTSSCIAGPKRGPSDRGSFDSDWSEITLVFDFASGGSS